MNDPGPYGRSTLRTRVATWFSIVFLAILVLLGWLIYLGVRDSLIDQLADDLTAQARLIALDLSVSGPQQERIDAQAAALAVRITVIAPDGMVLADSAGDPTSMDNHATRPEVVSALEGQVGRSTRLSATTGERRLYVALPPVAGQIVRVSVTEGAIADELRLLTTRALTTLVLIGLVGLLGVLAATTRVVRPIASLTDSADDIARGRRGVTPPRSSIAELDRLGLAIGAMASDLRMRIRQSESERATLDVVLSALPEGVLLVEPDERISFSNPAASRLLGFVPKRLPSLAPAALQRIVREARDATEVRSAEFEHGSSTGSIISGTATPFRVDPNRILLVIADVSDRHRTEAMRRDFVADASHELKTPIATILASMEAFDLALDRDHDRAVEFAHQAQTAAHRLARIVEDLFDLSRLETSDPTFDTCRLDEVVTEEVDRLRAMADDARIDLDLFVSPVEAPGPAAEWGLAVRNLCENAIRYSDPGGSVVVRVRADEGGGELTVEDTGLGIPSRALDRVFERFYRVDDDRSRYTGGTGLGLAIVKHVAERYGGSVAVTSELGSGSTFRIRFPRAHRFKEPPVSG